MPLSERDRKTLKIGGIVAGVLLVGVLLMNLLGGGGGEEALPSLPPTGGGSATGTPSVTPTPTATTSPVAIFTGRDPFSVPPGFTTTASTSTSTSASSSTSTSTSTPPSTSTSSTPTGSTGTPTAPGGGSSTTVGGHQVVLLDVYTINGVAHADVSVDGTVYHPAEGQRFGPNQQFQLTNVSGSCATVLFGDESRTLCITPQK